MYLVASYTHLHIKPMSPPVNFLFVCVDLRSGLLFELNVQTVVAFRFVLLHSRQREHHIYKCWHQGHDALRQCAL